jgi:hypothetical protein
MTFFGTVTAGALRVAVRYDEKLHAFPKSTSDATAHVHV